MAAIKTQTVPALDRALSILELLAKSRAGLTLPELVEQSALPRTSVHYLLVTLERRGYVQRNQRTSRYLFWCEPDQSRQFGVERTEPSPAGCPVSE